MGNSLRMTVVAFWVAGSLSASIASAATQSDCVDLAGVYQLTEKPSEITLTVTQVGCESVTVSYFYPANDETLGKVYPANGKRLQTYEDKNLIVYETAAFDAAGLSNTVEDFYRATRKTLKAVSIFHLNSDGNLLSDTDYFNYQGQVYKSTSSAFTRVK